jgi:RNA polymerase sigma factor (sigma-70 family)
MGSQRKLIPLTDEQRQLVADNIKLPRFVISKYYSLHSNDEDIHSIACEGLMLAAQKWDEDRGAFSTYATYIIRGVINKYFRGLTRLCRNENENRALHNTVRRMSRGEEFEADVFDEIASDENLEAASVDKITVAEAISILPPDQQEIIRMMYFEDMQQKDVAVHQGISPQGVDYRKRCALQKLREYFENRTEVE